MERESEVLEAYRACVPPQLPAGDQRDAAICALMALAFRSRYPECLAPLKEPAQRALPEGEGWIYYPPASDGPV